jgi:endoglucanase
VRSVPFIWCSNNLVVALATQGAMYERMTGVRDYRIFTARQRDWLFGTNPWGTSTVTGLGVVTPTDVHIPAIQLRKVAVPGGLVDGPVQETIFTSLKGVTLSRPDAFALFQSPEPCITMTGRIIRRTNPRWTGRRRRFC